MDWDAISAIGEAVGAVAVVVSVVYLALQVRANTRSSLQSMVQDTIKEFARIEHAIATTPDLARIIVRGHQTPEALTPEEALRYGGFNAMFFGVLENWHTQSRRLPLIPEQEDTVVVMLRSHVRNEGALAWWQKYRGEFPVGFQAWVEASRKPS